MLPFPNNLKDILNYRTHCLICQKALRLKCSVNALENISQVKLNQNFIKVGSLRFNFDGTYYSSKRFPEEAEALYLRKECERCSSLEDYVYIDALKTNTCKYSLKLGLRSNKKFSVSMIRDVVVYHTQESFWSIQSYPSSSYSLIHHGKFTEPLENIFKKELPLINLQSVKTPEDFIQKIKLYTTFS